MGCWPELVLCFCKFPVQKHGSCETASTVIEQLLILYNQWSSNHRQHASFWEVVHSFFGTYRQDMWATNTKHRLELTHCATIGMRVARGTGKMRRTFSQIPWKCSLHCPKRNLMGQELQCFGIEKMGWVKHEQYMVRWVRSINNCEFTIASGICFLAFVTCRGPNSQRFYFFVYTL